MDDLAERIEAAGVDEQRAMLEEAARFLRPDKFSYMDQTDGWRWEFERKLGTKAYESAAMMLFDNDGYLMIALNNASRFCESRDQIPLHLAAAAIRAGAK